MNNSIKLLLIAGCFAGTASAQILRVDSVKVDTVWNSDSSWYDDYGILQQRSYHDCKVSFIPQGEGYARMFIAISIDSGKTWAPSPNPLTVLNNGLASLYITGQKATLMVRVLGGDMPNVAFRVTARQAAPALAGNPKAKILGKTVVLTPGANAGVVLSVTLADVAGDGSCSISKIYWDVLGDGTIDDSTAGANAYTWTWLTQVPAGASGQKRKVIARARDKNNLWSVPETLVVQFGLLRPIVMKDIPAGTFTMGSSDVNDSAQPPHQVTLSAFRMQETEVTQEQYLAVRGTNPSYFTGNLTRPVEWVNWYDAAAFCNTLSVLSGLTAVYDTLTWTMDTSKNGYRLPTEAQWEYACRGGTTTTYWWGADTNGMGACAWTYYNSRATQPVGMKTANAYGLYDMVGNVFVWCNDLYEKYPAGAVTNPAGAAKGTDRIARGGGWAYDESLLHSAYRLRGDPSAYGYTTGFRIALPLR